MMGANDENATGTEKRRYQRFRCSLKMTFTILSSADSTPFEYGVASSKDLSEAGVCIFTEHNVRIPILMQLNISLPVRPFHLLVLAKALRCNRNEETGLYEGGLKFVGILPPEFKRLVRELAPRVEQDAESEQPPEGDAGVRSPAGRQVFPPGFFSQSFFPS